MMSTRFILMLFIFLGANYSLFAQSPKKLKALAEEYYNAKKYDEAYNLYSKYARFKSLDADTRNKAGLAALESNKLEESINFFESIIESEKKVKPSVYLNLAKALHCKNEFEKAIQNYKKYLAKTDFNDKRRESVKDNILRCASGLKLQHHKKQAVVENMGMKVNSTGDDIRPIISPNYDDKLYFSSARQGNVGGKRSKSGYPDEKLGAYRFDLFSTRIINGEWTSTTPLQSIINTAKDEILLDFNENGQVLFFYRGVESGSKQILVDSFTNQNKLSYPELKSPININDGDEYPFFFNDSILLFSALRTEGYGNLDLYISTYTNGYWTVPQNLGATINSPYDEVSPFLSKDGRTLYFSSNSTNGIGGYDIYKSKYNDAQQQWEQPINLGAPINSANDDRDFRLTQNGLEAHFASNRKSGMGGYDLYTAYFKNKLYEQTVTSNPSTFVEVPRFRASQATNIPSIAHENPNGKEEKFPQTVNFPETEIKNFIVKPIHFRNDNEILSQANQKQIASVIKLMNEHPQLKVMLTTHSDGSDPAMFDIFFAIKRAEKIAKYMVDNKINPSNIYLKGVGSNYPSALQQQEDGSTSIPAKKINNRIDIEVFNSAGLSIKIENQGPKVSKFLEDPRGQQYKQAIKGLSYKVQIAALPQNYKGDILFNYTNSLVEANYNAKLYQYTIGLFQNFSSAETLRKELLNQGITDAFVVPYINGVRASKEDSKIYAAAYPDLHNFLIGTGKN